MVLLLTLSDEILLEIVSYFDTVYSSHHKLNLAQIALVCHRLYALAIDFLLRKVNLNGATKKYDLFLQAIKNNSRLASKVRSLDLQWNDFLSKEKAPQELLTHLKNLQCLSLKLMQSYRIDPVLYCLPPSRSPDKCFYEMDIHLEKPAQKDISDLLLITGVHILKITIPRTNNIPGISLPESNQVHTTPLQSFTTIGATKISTHDLQNLLTYPEELTHLSIPLPAVENRDRAGRTLIAQMDGLLSPSAITRSLSPAASSLQSLEIHGHMQNFPDGHDGSQLSLREFKALRTATLSAHLFFTASASLTIDLYTLLPPSICEITVRPFFISLLPSSVLPILQISAWQLLDIPVFQAPPKTP